MIFVISKALTQRYHRDSDCNDTGNVCFWTPNTKSIRKKISKNLKIGLWSFRDSADFVKINKIQLFQVKFNDFAWISLFSHDFCENHKISEAPQADLKIFRNFLSDRFCVWCPENTFPGSLRSLSRWWRCVKVLKIMKIVKFQRGLCYAISMVWRPSSTTPQVSYCSKAFN